MAAVIVNIRKELRANVDSEYKKGCYKYFKESINLYGVRAPITRRIGSATFREVKALGKKEVFKLCEELLKSDMCEEKHIAFQWAFFVKKDYGTTDFSVFERWLKRYVKDWASCDDFCTHAFGHLLREFPELLPRIKKWAKSRNMWLRRASAVIMIYVVRGKRNLKDVFEIADTLLLDKEDLVQKGYGWMLKVASEFYPKEVFSFVFKRKDRMPRTALRYAIEKYSQSMRKKAMN